MINKILRAFNLIKTTVNNPEILDETPNELEIDMSGLNMDRCYGCKKGILPFIKTKKGSYAHLDIFATYEAAHSYPCTTPNINKYIKYDKQTNSYNPANKEIQSLYEFQYNWWYDMISICEKIFEDEKITSFLNEKIDKDTRTYQLPNEIIESKLITLAEKKGIQINKEDFPYFKTLQK